jgi:hypothetical protein
MAARSIALLALDMDTLGGGQELHHIITGFLPEDVVLLHGLDVGAGEPCIEHLLVQGEGDGDASSCGALNK